jgi:hypothetical protein
MSSRWAAGSAAAGAAHHPAALLPPAPPAGTADTGCRSPSLGSDRPGREAIRTALETTDVRVVGEAAGRWEAGDLLRRFEPDVSVVDGSLRSCRDLFHIGWGPVSRCSRIVVVGPDDPQLARRLIAMGAADYVARSRLAEDLPGSVADSRVSELRPRPRTLPGEWAVGVWPSRI